MKISQKRHTSTFCVILNKRDEILTDTVYFLSSERLSSEILSPKQKAISRLNRVFMN